MTPTYLKPLVAQLMLYLGGVPQDVSAYLAVGAPAILVCSMRTCLCHV